jgi:muramoyltetrapeptide carboxypeptidase
LIDAHPSNRAGKSTGQLVGGNLSLLVDSIGTANELETDGNILVIEEVDEYLYKLDRMMVQLKRAGKLNNLSGLIVGHITDIKDTELKFGERVEDIIRNHTSSFQFPIAFNFPIGHENPNLAWIHGAAAHLDVTEHNSNLSYL